MAWTPLCLAQHLPGAAGWLVLAGAPVLLLALWLDRRWGEPQAAWHPVVWIGRYLQLCGRVTVRCRPALAFVLGALAWALGVAVVAAVAGGLQAAALWQAGQAVLAFRAGSTPAWGPVLLGVLLACLLIWLLKCTLSWRMLRDEVAAVEAALQQSLPAGRERLSWLVSRDTSSLSESEVRESAIESLAENLNDSVVAPLFWFVLLGLPGAAVYRFANTADAMWGYRGVREGMNWEWAGKWAARADDVLSWLPARLTAALIWGLAGGVRLVSLRQEALRTPSPNSGWPMAAMALALGIRLGKPGVYSLNAEGRVPVASDTRLAMGLASKVVVAIVGWCFVAILLIAYGVA